MTETRDLTCIGCPMGCSLTVTLEDGVVTDLKGNSCPIGDKYGRKEVVDPRRTVTSTVKVKGGENPVVPVKTVTDIPKNKIFDCMAELNKIEICAPVKIGDVVCENVAGTDVKVVATKDIAAV